ncbi:hypothetical protein SAMN05660461_4415 [Chitinophaga ginsengisegetis]|uniref:Uncharacterized protein n=1 Tax=Chitinophaga ginsengisegetis TaxID=393003 RepID=A0A1T5P7L2_9BACT|nr:hypothetical protein [Chitinophaga ginsengisegetis]SKD08543.1 hypothetical protein SAMN05660461_4415 [Chitinophaga ginsengisegetis]
MQPTLGPQVILIDDIKKEVESLQEFFTELNIGTKLFEVDSLEPAYPDVPISTTELVFLDLFYNTGFGARFDAYVCIEWITKVVPAGQKYFLVIWSKDKSYTDELLQKMREMESPMPYQVEARSKPEYMLSGDNKYDISRLLGELGFLTNQEEKSTIQEFHGRVIAIEEDCVLINCLIHKETSTFEVRRFDLKLLENIKYTKGSFLTIRIETKSGSRTIDFLPDNIDRSDLFIKPDDFEDLDDVSFLIDNY